MCFRTKQAKIRFICEKIMFKWDKIVSLYFPIYMNKRNRDNWVN